MNNKGQSLVLFVLIIPILLGIIVLVVDVGRVIVEKNSISNKLEFIVNNFLDNDVTYDELTELVSYNLTSYDNKINLEDGIVIITTKTNLKGIISNIFGFKGFDIESEYKGYIKDEKKIIEKVK